MALAIQASLTITGLEAILYKFKNRRTRILRQIERGMYQGMLIFKEVVVKQAQLSGSTGSYGLNIRSGALRKSWIIDRSGTIDAAIVRLRSDSPYARIHQTGGIIKHPGGTPYVMFGKEYPEDFIHLYKNKTYSPQIEMRKKFTKPHDIRIPKRLYIAEDFHRIGKTLIMKKVVEEIENAIGTDLL